MTGVHYRLELDTFTAIVPGSKKTYSETAEQLKLHSLRGLWAHPNLTLVHPSRPFRRLALRDLSYSPKQLVEHAIEEVHRRVYREYCEISHQGICPRCPLHHPKNK